MIRVNPEMYWCNFARGEARFTVPFASNIGNNDLNCMSRLIEILGQ